MWSAEKVRMPHPLHMSFAISRSTIRVARPDRQLAIRGGPGRTTLSRSSAYRRRVRGIPCLPLPTDRPSEPVGLRAQAFREGLIAENVPGDLGPGSLRRHDEAPVLKKVIGSLARDRSFVSPWKKAVQGTQWPGERVAAGGRITIVVR